MKKSRFTDSQIMAAAQLGQGNSATSALLAASSLFPNDLDVQIALGNSLFAEGDLNGARICFSSLIEKHPELSEAHFNLGNVNQSLGRFEESVANYESAIRYNDQFVQAHGNLGNALSRIGRVGEAAKSYLKALELKPDDATTLTNLGNTMKAMGKLIAAVTFYERALAASSASAAIYINLSDAFRQLGLCTEALVCLEKAAMTQPDALETYQSMLFTHCYLSAPDDDGRRRALSRYVSTLTDLTPVFSDWTNSADPKRTLRIGFVSGDLCSHPVGYFLESVLKGLLQAPDRPVLIAYSASAYSDELTAQLCSLFDFWHDVVPLNDLVFAKKIRDDEVDILIDLSGHTARNRLRVFAMKPAPVQVSWLGYFATTGLPAMDYFIADPHCGPLSFQADFAEKLFQLPETRMCFSIPKDSLDVSPLPALTNGHITFGNFSDFSKMNDHVLDSWARILRAIPSSRMLIKSPQFEEPWVRQTVLQKLTNHGVNTDRISLEGKSPRLEYLERYQVVDVVLDTFPFPGGTTTAEALWMGVPVLTLNGNTLLGCQGASMLINAGLPEWVASDVDDFVKRAMTHTASLDKLNALRQTLRDQAGRSPLFDSCRFADHFSNALREMWRIWCAKSSRSQSCK